MADTDDNQQQDGQAKASIDVRDAGFMSRKFWFAVGTTVLIFGGGILSGLWQLFGPHYETMISGLIGVLTVYLGGNVGSRWVAAKHVQALAATVEKKTAEAAGKRDQSNKDEGPEPKPPVEPLPEE